MTTYTYDDYDCEYSDIDATRKDYMSESDSEFLTKIHLTGLIADADDIFQAIQRYKREQTPLRNPCSEFQDSWYEDSVELSFDDEFGIVSTVIYNLMADPICHRGFVEVGKPIYNDDDRSWMIRASLTEAGQTAVWAHQHDLLFDMNRLEVDFGNSLAYWEEAAECTSFPGKETFDKIESLRHPVYDRLRASIPELRMRLWTSHFERTREPAAAAWLDIGKHSPVVPGTEELRRRFLPLHRACWMRALPSCGFRSYLFQSYKHLSDDYAEVKAAWHARECELWVERITTCTSPDNALWDEVAKLGESFQMVKAEAFLRKMQVWTPVNPHGGRS